MTNRRSFTAGALALVLPAGLSAAEVDLQRHGIVLLIRHAQTVAGIGDPPEFKLGDCATQRNLDERGRNQAVRLGETLRGRAWAPQRVRSSAWCRCVDTATLAFGRAEPWAALNSFMQQRQREPAQTAELRQALAALAPGRIEAWVTHQVNISALTGEPVTMGEVLVLRGGPGDVQVLLRLTA